MRRPTLPSLLAMLLLSGAADAYAQTVPFGKNKVQYRDFDWHILGGEHVDVYYYPEEEEVARLALAYAEESYRHLERKFRHHPFGRIPLIVYSSDRHFEQTNVFPGMIPEGVLGFTEYLKRRIALPFRGDYAQFRHTLRHELVHYFQLSKLDETRALHPGQPEFSPQQIHWWTEGLAEYWSSEQTVEDRMYVRDLVMNGELPSVARFTRSRGFMAYPLGAELHAFLAGRFGEEYIVELYEDYWKYATFDAALQGVLGVGLGTIDREFARALQRRFYPGYSVRAPLATAADRLVGGPGNSFMPTLHSPPDDTVPDLFFLSSRTGYTNIYRMPLGSDGDGVEAVVEGQRRAEFASFHAYESRIDVSRGGVIAFVSEYLERDALFLWDLARGEVVGRYQWPDLVGLRSPDWHPSGRRIVFEGLSVQGYSDLYVLDFRSQRRIALTSDRFRDTDPDWSPDGETIVFASDRTAFGEDGHTNLFLLDVEARRGRYLTYGAWHDRDPRWARDGDRVAFSSDRAGEYDLYVVDRDGRGRRVTGMTGGAFEPVWLPGDDGLVFSGYGDGRFRIYRRTFTRDTAAYPVFALAAEKRGPVAGLPAERTDVAAKADGWRWVDLAEADIEKATRRSYEGWRSISVDVAAGAAAVAPGIGSSQGAQVMATDMLGNHVVFGGIAALQTQDASDALDNLSGRLLYLNLTHRLNFGVGAYRFRGDFYDTALDRYREASYGTYFLASYPFSRFRRLELQIGAARSRRYDLADGYALGTDDLGRVRDLTRDGVLTTNYLSLVKDNALWLPTGPIAGERYNLSAGVVSCFSCTLPGDVVADPVTRRVTAENYVVYGDYRRYLRTSTRSACALRAYAYYSAGEIPSRTILGGPHRLRGYPRYSLAGSRVWLVNQEWRFPLTPGPSAASAGAGGFLPGVQGALFVDAGSSWLENQTSGATLGSYGASLRAPLGPALVLRLDVGRRFHIGDPRPIRFDPGEDFDDTFVDFFFGYNY